MTVKMGKDIDEFPFKTAGHAIIRKVHIRSQLQN
jgi:hypothetical protein